MANGRNNNLRYKNIQTNFYISFGCFYIQWAEFPQLVSNQYSFGEPVYTALPSDTAITYPISFNNKTISILGNSIHMGGTGAVSTMNETKDGFHTFANAGEKNYGTGKYYLAIGI